jgi:hypothetical protein
MGDLLYNFTEWLRETPLTELSLWIGETWLSLWLVERFWAIPIIQVIHILAIGASFGAILMLNLRIFGRAGMDRTMAETERRYMPWIWWSLVVLAISGLGLIIAEPIRELINPIFWIKMVLVVVAILTTLWFHRKAVRPLARGAEPTGAVKAVAVFVIILWCVIILCGRWIAYAPV